MTQIEQLPEVLPTVDPQLGALVRAQLEAHGVTVRSGTAVSAISRAERGAPGAAAGRRGRRGRRAVSRAR